MICMDISLKFYFDGVEDNGNGYEKCEKAIEELFNEVFCERKEYIKTEARVRNVGEVV